jgi:hypothetical protein
LEASQGTEDRMLATETSDSTMRGDMNNTEVTHSMPTVAHLLIWWGVP